MSATKSYRNAQTGHVREYPVSLAKRFPQLVEVEPDAKPLAYTPIPQSEIYDYLASRSSADQTAAAPSTEGEN